MNTETNGQPKGEFVELELSSVIPSDFPPQVRRRERFTDESLITFGESIKETGGIINPITVRRKGDKFQIIAGERRWRGTEKAGFATIPAIVKDISDEQQLKIHIKENLDREDLHPMDEAYTYEIIQQTYGYDDEQLAQHVAKDIAYVKTRLKLNKLQKEVQAAFERNDLLIGHALEIGKYPVESQNEIMQLAFTNDALKSVKNFRESIAKNFLRQLEKAPFSTTAENLRKDRLPCVKCPARTGAEQNLFGETVGEKDCCMNPVCWAGKEEMSIFRKREEVLAADFGVDISKPKEVTKNLSKVPLISNDYYVYDRDKPKEGYIGYHDYIEIKSKKTDCKYSRRGIYFNGNRKGEVITFCNSSSCPTHAKKSAREKSAMTEEQIEAELQKKRARREEILDAKVGEPVRVEVLRQAVAQFDGDHRVYDLPNAADYLLEWLWRTWEMQCNFSSRTAGLIRDLMNVKAFGREMWRNHRADVEALNEDQKAKLHFLLLAAHKGEIDVNYGNYKDQTEILQIAEDFGINYKLLDARERAKHISKKNMPEYKKYLDAVEAGDLKIKLPRFFNPDYVPPKK